MLIFKTLKDFSQMQGKTLPIGEWYTITQQMITDFANATLDKQWIHVDVERAKKESPFQKTIAHGFMSVAMISKLLESLFKVESVTMGLNYGLNKVRFPNPVVVDSKLRMHAEVVKIEPLSSKGIKVTFLCTIEIKGEEKPACVAEFIAALFE